MPITDNYARLPLSQISIDRGERQRRAISTKGLVESIKIRGVLNPVIIEREVDEDGCHRLVAGERRCMASKELGLPDVPVRFIDELSPLEAKIIELEENVRRQDLDWPDQVEAIYRIHLLYCELDASWTQDKTTDELGFAKGTISTYITVAKNLATNPELRKSDNVRQAYNTIQRSEERKEALRLDEIIHGAPLLITPGLEAPVFDYRPDGHASKNILLESFHHWAPKYTGVPFNLIHCDFPYGIDVFEGPQSGVNRHDSYGDSRETHFKLLETLLVNFDQIASDSCNVVFWFSMQHYEAIKTMVRDIVPELVIWPHPLIWHKTDNSGIAADAQHGPRHVYETALLMTRGKRLIIKPVADAYGCQSDRTLHIHTKPEPMLRHFFTMLVDEHTVFLDPTCGSGSSIRAAESLGAKYLVGMDTDETTVGAARAALNQFRAKRTAAAAASATSSLDPASAPFSF